MSNVCEHGCLRRKCPNCENAELEAKLQAADEQNYFALRERDLWMKQCLAAEAEVARILDQKLQPKNLREQSLMIENMSIRRTATEAALRRAVNDVPTEDPDLWVASGLAALLGEGE